MSLTVYGYDLRTYNIALQQIVDNTKERIPPKDYGNLAAICTKTSSGIPDKKDAAVISAILKSLKASHDEDLFYKQPENRKMSTEVNIGIGIIERIAQFYPQE